MTPLRSSVRVVAGMLLLAAAAVATISAPAGAAALDDAGWWYRLNPAPAPPNLPEDGLFVEGTPEGPLAVAAVRYTLAEGETNPILELVVAGRGEGDDEEPPPMPVPPGTPVPPAEESPAMPVVLACAAATPWTGVQGGPFEDAPKPDCTAGSVTGQVAEDGSTYTFPIGMLQQGPKVDIVLLPGSVEGAPNGAAGSTFELAFEAPDDGSLRTTPSEPAGAAAGRFADPSPAPPGGGSFAPGGSSGPPSLDVPTAAPPSAPAPVGEDGSTFSPPTEGDGVGATAAPARRASDDSGLDLDTVAVLLLVAAAVAAFLAGQRDARPVRSLSRFASEPVANLAATAAGPRGLGGVGALTRAHRAGGRRE